jgi:hypothetical protein
MNRDHAIRIKLRELAVKLEGDDPRAARVLRALASAMYGNGTSELGSLAERFLRRMLTAAPATSHPG